MFTYQHVGHSLFYTMTEELQKQKLRAGCQLVSNVAFLLIYIYIYITPRSLCKTEGDLHVGMLTLPILKILTTFLLLVV